jgi:hypothetical protein
MKLQRLGGYALFASAFVYIAALALVVRIRPLGDWNDPVKMMAAVSAAPSKFYLSLLLWIASYMLFLIAIIALHERMQANAPNLTRLMLIAMSAATAMAIVELIINLKSVAIIISQQDMSAFRACWAVTQGLHWANGHAFAWTCLFLGCAILRTCAFSRIPGLLFLLTGILWIPNFFFVQIGFGLLTPIYMGLFGVATVWIGIALLWQKQPQPASREMAASR